MSWEMILDLGWIEVLLDYIWNVVIYPIAPSCLIIHILFSEYIYQFHIELFLFHQPVDRVEIKNLTALNILGLYKVKYVLLGPLIENILHRFQFYLLSFWDYIESGISSLCLYFSKNWGIRWVDIELTSFREIKEEGHWFSHERFDVNSVWLCVIQCINWDCSLWNFYQDLEFLTGDWAICDNYLTTIDLVDEIFFYFFFGFLWGIVFRSLVSIVWIKESLSYEDVILFLELAFFDVLMEDYHIRCCCNRHPSLNRLIRVLFSLKRQRIKHHHTH